MQNPQPGKEGSTGAEVDREQRKQEAKELARFGYDSVRDIVVGQEKGGTDVSKGPDDQFWTDDRRTSPFTTRSGEQVFISVRSTEPAVHPAPEGGIQPDSIEVKLWQRMPDSEHFGEVATVISPREGEGDPRIELGEYGHVLHPDMPDHEIAPVVRDSIEQGHLQAYKLRGAT